MLYCSYLERPLVVVLTPSKEWRYIPWAGLKKLTKSNVPFFFVKRIFKCIKVVGIIILKKMQNAHCSFAHFSIMRSCIEIMLHTWCRLNISSTNFKLQLKIGSLGQTCYAYILFTKFKVYLQVIHFQCIFFFVSTLYKRGLKNKSSENR